MSTARRPSDDDEPAASNNKRQKKEHNSQLTVLSWNLAGCIPSQQSPDDFDQMTAMCSQLDVINNYDADVLLLQECPKIMRQCFSETHNLVGTKQSHSDDVHLWIKKSIASYEPITTLPENHPTVAATITINNNTSIGIASSHLMPFKQNAALRLSQIETLCTFLPPTCILGGDYNMRQDESRNVEKLLLQDAWKLAGSDERQKITWNSLANQNEYHGDAGYQFKCRFDRVYVRGDPPLQVTSFELIGNEPLTRPDSGHRWYLSDHYGMVVKIRVNEQE